MFFGLVTGLCLTLGSYWIYHEVTKPLRSIDMLLNYDMPPFLKSLWQKILSDYMGRFKLPNLSIPGVTLPNLPDFGYSTPTIMYLPQFTPQDLSKLSPKDPLPGAGTYPPDVQAIINAALQNKMTLPPALGGSNLPNIPIIGGMLRKKTDKTTPKSISNNMPKPTTDGLNVNRNRIVNVTTLQISTGFTLSEVTTTTQSAFNNQEPTKPTVDKVDKTQSVPPRLKRTQSYPKGARRMSRTKPTPVTPVNLLTRLKSVNLPTRAAHVFNYDYN